MSIKSVKSFIVKAIAVCSVCVVSACFAGAYINPVSVSADSDHSFYKTDSGLFTTLYDVFKSRSDDPDNFQTQEEFRWNVLYNCSELEGVEYTYGNQDHYLGCEGFVSLVFRKTFGTLYDFERTKDKYSCKFDRSQEHILACSPVDQYEVYRPGGTSVTWLYKNYVNVIIEPRYDKINVEDMNNYDWIEFMDSIAAQPGDIIFWDEDSDDQYWTHIGIYAGVEDGVAMMWHASSIKGAVVKQSLEEITSFTQYLDYACVVALTDVPARVGLYVDSLGNPEKDFSYSIYDNPECTKRLGRISNVCDLNDGSYLNSMAIFPNDDKMSYDLTIYVRRDMVPYTEGGTDPEVYQVIIHIDVTGHDKGTLTYSVYGADDIRFYCSRTIDNYNYMTGYRVIEITDYR